MEKLIAGDKNQIIYSKKDGLKLFNITRYNARTVEYVIKTDKQLAVFIPLAVRGKDGGWIRTRQGTTCINIPDEKSKNFTQYALRKPLHNGQGKNAKYALFVQKDRKPGYVFYGVFTRKESELKEDEYSTYFKWKSDELVLSKWQKE